MNKTIVFDSISSIGQIEDALNGEVFLGLIGGSIFDFGQDIFGTTPKIIIKPGAIKTPFDTTYDLIPGDINVYSVNGKHVAVINRHGLNHRLLPHEIPYKTIIYTLRMIGVEFITGFSACGSINKLIPVGSLALPNQFIDRTIGRSDTFFGKGLVGHIPSSDPFCIKGINEIADALKSTGEKVFTYHNLSNQKDLTIVVINGPRFSTRAESKMFRSWGADIVCMTPYPEVILALEAGMCYISVMIVTDVDAGKDTYEAVNVKQVLKVLKEKNQMMPQYIDAISKIYLFNRDCRCHQLVCGALQSKGNLTLEQQTMFSLFTEVHTM